MKSKRAPNQKRKDEERRRQWHLLQVQDKANCLQNSCLGVCSSQFAGFGAWDYTPRMFHQSYSIGSLNRCDMPDNQPILCTELRHKHPN